MTHPSRHDPNFWERKFLRPRKTAVGGNVPRPPTFESLCADTRLRLSSVECALSSLSNEEISRARSSCHSRIRRLNGASPVERLYHPLSEHFIQKHRQENRPIEQITKLAAQEKERASAEEGAGPLIYGDLSLALRSDEAGCFIQTLVKAASFGIDRRTAIRTGDVSLGADREGQYWAFPRAERLMPLLQDLHSNLKSSRDSSPLLAAIVALVTINCIHPFMDGNGRTSRIVFNAMLVDGGKFDQYGYIPCKQIYAISKYGFEIRLRQIILKNEWLPLIDYFIELIDLFCALGRQSGITELRE